MDVTDPRLEEHKILLILCLTALLTEEITRQRLIGAVETLFHSYLLVAGIEKENSQAHNKPDQKGLEHIEAIVLVVFTHGTFPLRIVNFMHISRILT